MKKYKIIPLPELCRMYRRRRMFRMIAMDLVVTVLISAPYGIMIALMAMGLWIVF